MPATTTATKRSTDVDWEKMTPEARGRHVAKARMWRRTNKDRANAYSQRWRAKDGSRERMNAGRAVWSLTLRGRFRALKYVKKRRGIEMTMTFEQYVEAIGAGLCGYCEFPVSPTGIGLDRLDNSRGYSPDNVLPCCGECNVARNDLFSPDAMRRHLGPAIRRSKEETLIGAAVFVGLFGGPDASR